MSSMTSDAMPSNGGRKRYLVVLRASSGLRFTGESAFFKIEGFATSLGPVDLIFRTRLVNEGLEVPIPREMWVEVQGNAPSLEQALNVFARAVHALVPALCLSANAPTDDLEVHLGYDNMPGHREREFFQSFLLEERGMPRQGRRINIPATKALLSALHTHSEHERLTRAVGQYHQALRHWIPGHQTLALAHLYIGMEALTPVAREQRLAADRLTRDGLAAAWGIELKQLDSEVRRRILFQGDDECFRKSREASDGFEHGFLDFDLLRAQALEVRDRAASYLRAAILTLSGVEPTQRYVLLQPPFDRPLEWFPYARYLRGTLIGDRDDLAQEGNQYPIMRWEWSIKSATTKDGREYTFSIDQKVTPMIGSGVQFRPETIELWGPTREPRPYSVGEEGERDAKSESR